MKALLERESEMEALRTAVAETGKGIGRALAIEAGAGMGKTLLLQKARSIADEAGLNLLFGRATELERDFPFALVRQLFEAELAALSTEEQGEILEGATAARGALGLDPEPGGTDDTFAVLHGLYWVTAALAERRPLMLAIDDAHWADSGSLDYLNFLLPRLEEMPVLLVLTLRPDEPGSPPGLERVLLDSSLQHLTPAALSSEATVMLLSTELGQQPDPGFAQTCHEACGGNPFLLCELARSLAAQGIEPSAGEADRIQGRVPERVGQMVLARISRLSAEAAEIARSLAVLGDGNDLNLLAATSGSDLEATQKAADELRAGAIFDSGVSLRFIHPLVRDAIYADIPVGERSRAHARAAALLRERRASPGEVGTQLLATEAGGNRATVEALLEAGNQALGSGAPRSAIAYLGRALREPPPIELRAEVLEPLFTACFRATDHSAFAAAEKEVFEEWERNPSVRSRWGIQLGMLMAFSGRLDEAGSILQEAFDAAISENDVARAYQLRAQLGTLAAIMPSLDVRPDADPMPEVDPDSPAGRLVAATEMRAAIVNGTASEAVDAAKRTLGPEAGIFTEDQEVSAAVLAVMTLVLADEIESARHGAERALAVAKESGGAPELTRAHYLGGFVAWGEGDLLTAQADMLQVVDLAGLAGIMPVALVCTGPLVEVLIERDELDEAEARLRAVGLADGDLPTFSLAGMAVLNRGRLRLERGDFNGAVEDLGPLSSEPVKSKVGLGPAALSCVHAVRALMALGRIDEARALTDEVAGWARNFGAASFLLTVARADAAVRDGDEGIHVLVEALAEAADSAWPLARAHALVDLGEALRRSGRRADARVPLREAFDLARRCGAARIAKRANAELEATGEKVRRYAPIGIESLTPSERRVADMAASGMTNRQIAQSLFVTVKTVEAHLSAAYDKLDIGSRRELPHALGGEGPSSS